ncbi:RNA-directed DNA polymerase [Donghicola sp.]|uniref:RNA-directed DNA polymerase n=1 Tax=Donghicola sp. TaxID=1929294 RepID=UPI0025D1D0A4|nr:RNA-directed DNA polymerase [Donghicola sp.]MCT4576031.1 RNA-directed DNA polymerase [Donghicola sp.]
MTRIIDLNANEAKKHFLKGSSYFNGDFPNYISFEPILKEVDTVLSGGNFNGHKNSDPKLLPGVNYSFVANKDGRFAWRPYELMHPAIYVSLVNSLCSDEHWELVTSKVASFERGIVTCCSAPLISTDIQSDQAAQVRSWWQSVEQRSIELSLEFSHILHTDVTDCYGSLYTHSIEWALDGYENSKKNKRKKNNLIGSTIDSYIQSGRYGQTNGISQGSVLMDFIAEIILGYVDELITYELLSANDFRILRYRDDYRIFTNSDVRAEEILKVISDKLRIVGMRLGVSKTFISTNVVEGSIKPDKLAGIELQDLGTSNAQTLQKQLLRLHSFGRRFPNSGALRRLIGELHSKVVTQTEHPEDLEVQVAIATDIAVVSPLTFPAVAGILSHLISLAPGNQKSGLWNKVHVRMQKVPYNGYLEVWLQRVTKPEAVAIEYESKERLCQIVNGGQVELWENSWISNKQLIAALDPSKIVVNDATKSPEVMAPSEVELFKKNAWQY